MANPLRGQVEVELAGSKRVLRLGAMELRELQQQLGRGPIKLCQSGELDYLEAQTIIHLGLQGAGVRQRFEKTIALLDGMKVSAVVGVGLAVLIAGCGFGAEEDEGAEKKDTAPGENP